MNKSWATFYIIELNKNKRKTYRNCWDTEKATLKKFIAIRTYILCLLFSFYLVWFLFNRKNKKLGEGENLGKGKGYDQHTLSKY